MATMSTASGSSMVHRRGSRYALGFGERGEAGVEGWVSETVRFQRYHKGPVSGRWRRVGIAQAVDEGAATGARQPQEICAMSGLNLVYLRGDVTLLVGTTANGKEWARAYGLLGILGRRRRADSKLREEKVGIPGAGVILLLLLSASCSSMGSPGSPTPSPPAVPMVYVGCATFRTPTLPATPSLDFSPCVAASGISFPSNTPLATPVP